MVHFPEKPSPWVKHKKNAFILKPAKSLDKEIVMTESVENSINSIQGTLIAGNRVHVVVELSENNTKPNLMMTLSDAHGNEVSRSIILGVLDPHVEFTLHIRVSEAPFPLNLVGTTFIEEEQPIDSRNVELAGLE
jgi:hypothetical protein